MELNKAGLTEQPFRTHGAPLTFVHYEGQVAATEFLRAVWTNPHGLGLLQGPSLSGKTTIIHHFIATLHEDPSVAVVDAAQLNADDLPGRVIEGFGFDLKLDTVSEQMNFLRVFIMQQAATEKAPLLIVDNAQSLNPVTLKLLNDLAGIEAGNAFALRIVLSGNRDVHDLIVTPKTPSIATRLMGTFNMVPMDNEEVGHFVRSKLGAGGCSQPTKIAPDAMQKELHQASGGWPGMVDRLMTLALAEAKQLPLTAKNLDRPQLPEMTGNAGLQLNAHEDIEISGAKLYLTYKGRTLREIPLDSERIILGRTDHNDISISSRFISRNHALFIRDGSFTLLMDLNSTNGTFVNSRRISNHIMVHDDVISLGHHGLKFCDPSAVDTHPLIDVDMDDTIIMKNVDDVRRRMARENTRIASVAKGKQAS
ncbi:MAG: FHA domain-containing protein [Woeseia sp.]|nr:FHA domain-containing protein [Woeseia sp.]